MAPHWTAYAIPIIVGGIGVAVQLYLRRRGRLEREITQLNDNIQRLEPAIGTHIAFIRARSQDATAMSEFDRRYEEANRTFAADLPRVDNEKDRRVVYRRYRTQLGQILVELRLERERVVEELSSKTQSGRQGRDLGGLVRATTPPLPEDEFSWELPELRPIGSHLSVGV